MESYHRPQITAMWCEPSYSHWKMRNCAVCCGVNNYLGAKIFCYKNVNICYWAVSTHNVLPVYGIFIRTANSIHLESLFKMLTQFLKLSLFFSTLHRKPQKNTHTQLEKANTFKKFFKTMIFPITFYFGILTVHTNIKWSSTYTPNYTHVNKLKQYLHVSLACSECTEEQELVIALTHTVHAYAYTLYVQYVWLSNCTQLCKWTESILNWLDL